MRVCVRLYATLVRFSTGGIAGTPFNVDVPTNASLADLHNLLKIPPNDIKITFVNGIIHELDWKLKPGDEVGIFPPIAGG